MMATKPSPAQSTFHGYPLQTQFYDEFINGVVEWVPVTDELVHSAYDECLSSRIHAFDALHIAAAAAVRADEFITGETATSRIIVRNL